MKKYNIYISVFVLFVCNLQLYGQKLDDNTENGISEIETAPFKSVCDYKGVLESEHASLFNIKNSMQDVIKDYSEMDYKLKEYLRFESFWDSRVGSGIDNPGNFNDYLNAINAWSASTPVCPNDQAIVDWNSIGADVIYNSSGNQVLANGIVTAVYMNPLNSNEILVGTNCSGIWRTVDRGAHWVCVTDNLRFPGLGIQDFEVDPTNSNFIIAATGKSTYGKTYGAGVLMSNDGGGSWTRNNNFPYANYPVTIKNSFGPTNNEIYTLTKNELLWSGDNGGSWTGIFDLSISSGVNTSLYQSLLSMVVTDNGTMFLGGIKKYASHTQIWRADPYSYNFVDISGNFPGINPNGILEVHFTEIVNNKFFVGISDGYSNGDFKIFKTIDGGNTFTFFNSGFENPQGLDKLGFSMSLSGSDRVYNGACGLAATTATSNNMMQNVNCGLIAETFHTDIRASQTLIDQNNKELLVIGHDGGISVFDITNNPQSSPYYNSVEGLNGQGLTINQMYSVSVSQFTNKKLLTGNQDNNSFSYDVATNTWSKIGGGDGGKTFYNSDGSEYLYTQNSFVSSTLSGINSFAVSGWALNMPIEVDEKNNYVYYVQSATTLVGAKINRKYNGGLTSLEIPLSTNLNTISEVEYSSSDQDVIYFSGGSNGSGSSGGGTSDNKFFKSIDGLQSYINLSNSTVYNSAGNNPKLLKQVLAYRMISAIEINPAYPNELWVGISSVALPSWQEHEKYRCLHSVDGGNTWYDYSENLPPFPLNDLEYVKGTNNVLIAGTDVGAFKRETTDSEWQCFQGDMPVAVITDIAVDYCDKKIYMSTFGRGVFRTDLNFPIDEELPELIIENDQTISESYNCIASIRIKEGSKLTITGTLYMNEYSNIIVEQGAQLIVNGGTITNACGGLWLGIEVWGNSSFKQSPTSNQGKVTLVDAAIEHAHCAITLRNRNQYGQTGGIVQATNSTFLNNRRSVSFYSYNATTSNGLVIPNKSYFNRVDFIWDNEFRHTPLTHVTLWDVSGVNFIGCEFSDERTGNHYSSPYLANAYKTATGIGSVDATYYVGAYCNNISGNGCSGDIEDLTTGFIPSRFTNLDFGIYASSTACSSIKVDRSIFTDNLYGILMESLEAPKITFNKFKYTDNSNFPNNTRNGIRLYRTQGFQIEENLFENSSTVGSTNGIVCTDLGESNEEIRKNHFIKLTNGIRTQGKNRNSNGLKGLEFYCNSHEYSDQDYLIENTLWGIPYPLAGVKSIMGDQGIPTGNNFITSNSGSCSHFSNQTQFPIGYYYSNSNSNYPSLSCGLFTSTTTAAASCQSNLSPCVGCPQSGVNELQLTASFESVSNGLVVHYDDYNSKMDGGDSDGLLNMVNSVTPQNIIEIRQVLLSISPYLSEKIVKLVANIPTSLYQHNWVEELVLANIDLAKSPGFMMFLGTKSEPLPSTMISNIELFLASSQATPRNILESKISGMEGEKANIVNYFLKKSQLDEEGTDVSLFRTWINHKSNPLLKTRIIDSYFKEGDYTKASEEITVLSETLDSYNGDLKLELLDYISLKQKLLEFHSSGTELPDMLEIDKDFIRNIAENTNGIAKYQAKGIMCFFFNECQPEEYEIPESNNKNVDSEMGFSNKEKNDLNELIEFNLYPNPTSGKGIIEIKYFDTNQKYEVVIRDLLGKELQRELIDKTSFDFDISKEKSGIYFLELLNGKKSKVIKLIKTE